MARSVRIGGLDSLGSPVEWEYLESNRAVAKKVLTDLEDRRVLWNPYGREDPILCRKSADDIRQLMKKQIPKARSGDDLERALREIRAAARDFVEASGEDSVNFQANIPSMWEALEDMRTRIAPHMLSMSMAFRIPLEREILQSLPSQDLSVVSVTD